MPLLYRNNAFSTLAAGITNSATTITVSPGHGDRFPVANGTDFFHITLQDASNNIEIVRVTARASGSDSMTVTRAQEGTTARSWSTGAVIELRLTQLGLRPLELLEGADTAALIRSRIGAVGTSGAETIAGSKTFSSPIIGSITGSAATVADGAVTTAKIADGAVTTAKIADDAVTFAKMQNIATARLLGRTSAGSGDVEELTGAQAQALQPIQQTRVDVASAATVNLTTGAANTDHVNITGTTTITGFTVAAGRLVFVRFAGALTLTNNANIVTQTGANILTQAGDTCILRATAANTVEVLCYTSLSEINLGVSVASTSGTAIDFTGIPSWARRVTVMFNGVSTNGASPIQVQIGGSGGIETTGYLGAASFAGGTNSTLGTNSTTGLLVTGAVDASAVSHGVAVIVLMGGNSWVYSSVNGRSNTNFVQIGAGSKTLSNPLDRLRITTVNGTDTFDAGTINISWE